MKKKIQRITTKRTHEQQVEHEYEQKQKRTRGKVIESEEDTKKKRTRRT
jgi:hypothetical protein